MQSISLKMSLLFSIHLSTWDCARSMPLKTVMLIIFQVKGKDTRPKFLSQFCVLEEKRFRKWKNRGEVGIHRKKHLTTEIPHRWGKKKSQFVWTRTKWLYSSQKHKIASFTSWWVGQYHLLSLVVFLMWFISVSTTVSTNEHWSLMLLQKAHISVVPCYLR